MSTRATITILDNIVKKTYDPEYRNHWEREVMFLHSFKHDNVVVPIEINEKELSITMPNVGKDMSKVWKTLTNEQKMSIIDQFVDVLFSLHKNCWLLPDLYCRNALVRDNHLTIIDFEQATQIELLPFKNSPVFIHSKKYKQYVYWDHPVDFSLSSVTEVPSKDIVEKVRQKLIEKSLLVSGSKEKSGGGQPNYQAIDVPNLSLPGLRSIKERLSKLGITDLKGKSVLDVGCNIGGVGIHCAHLGAKEYLGIEMQPCRVDFANDLIAFVGAVNNKVVCGDLQQLMSNEKYDIVFALAIDRYVDWKWFYKKLFEITNEVCYIESNRHAIIEKTKQEIEKVGFKAQFLFRSDEIHNRVNFICRKM